jgi:hypothetical protein
MWAVYYDTFYYMLISEKLFERRRKYVLDTVRQNVLAQLNMAGKNWAHLSSQPSFPSQVKSAITVFFKNRNVEMDEETIDDLTSLLMETDTIQDQTYITSVEDSINSLPPSEYRSALKVLLTICRDSL